MALYGSGLAPAVKDRNGETVTELGGSLTGSVTGDMADIQDIAISTSGGNTYSDSAVNAAVNAAIGDVNLQLKELQTKFNALIAHLNDRRT